MMERHLLRYFLAVVDAGTFSRAADLCRVSQPTVSSGIARLEQLIGQPLFNRSNRRVELTAAGTRLVSHARRIEAAFLDAQKSIAQSPAETLIRLGLATTISTSMVELALSACVRQAGIRLELVERRPSELAALLDRGRVDLILGPLAPSSRGRAIKLFEEPYLMAMAATHALADRKVIAPDLLANETMLVRRQCEILPLVSQFFTARGIRPFMAARSTSEERIATYVRADLGMTVMPASLARSGIAMRPLAGFDVKRTVGLMLEPGNHGRVSLSGIVPLISDVIKNAAIVSRQSQLSAD